LAGLGFEKARKCESGDFIMKAISVILLFFALMSITSLCRRKKADEDTDSKESYILDEIIVTAQGYSSEIKRVPGAQGYKLK
jgi:hypothetical protein